MKDGVFPNAKLGDRLTFWLSPSGVASYLCNEVELYSTTLPQSLCGNRRPHRFCITSVVIQKWFWPSAPVCSEWHEELRCRLSSSEGAGLTFTAGNVVTVETLADCKSG